MKYLCKIFIFFTFSNSVFSHEPNEAFFKFKLEDGNITVEAELTWAMRNALIDYNPKLKNASNKQDFEASFFEYIKHNLILKNKNGKKLAFQKFEEVSNNGHSHQNNYQLTFNGEGLAIVTNTIMFNHYKNQVNYNTIDWTNKKYVTSNKIPSFSLNEQEFHFSQTWWLFFVIISLVILLLVLKKTNFRPQN